MKNSNLYHCYLIRSLQKPEKKHSYIGFTNNPSRRIRQHNGEITSGARQTSELRPWKYVCVVSGFPNKQLALQFEWQWQNPKTGRLSKLVHPPPKKKAKGGEVEMQDELPQDDGYTVQRRRRKQGTITEKTNYSYKLRVLRELLEYPLWNQLHLTLYLIDQELERSFNQIFSKKKPHNGYEVCRITDEGVSSLDANQFRRLSGKENVLKNSNCTICVQPLLTQDKKLWQCPQCCNSTHLQCSAKKYKTDEALIPKTVKCERCNYQVEWWKVVRTCIFVRDDKTTLAEEDEGNEEEVDVQGNEDNSDNNDLDDNEEVQNGDSFVGMDEENWIHQEIVEMDSFELSQFFHEDEDYDYSLDVDSAKSLNEIIEID
jgi:predicted GIY-YIG superfamily endonuclease